MKYTLTFILLLLAGSLRSYAADTTKVLFIGNSFVSSNNLPDMFQNLATGAGHQVRVFSHAPGGIFVGDTRPGANSHAYDPYVYGLIRSDKWDYVVIQDNQGFYSYGVGVFPPYSMVVEGHRQLRDSIVANNPCAKVVLFSGWCFKNGFPPDFYNGSDMNQRVYENYVFINKTLNVIVCPISISWNRIIKAMPAVDLWAADEAHPSYAGSYLAAATIYSSIFRSSPEPVNYKGTLDSVTARKMRGTAYQAVIDSIAPTSLSNITVSLSKTGTQLNAATGFKRYEWYQDNALIATTTTPTHGPVTEGHCYQVVATANNDCRQRSAATCSFPTGISETALSGAGISMYPNPASDVLYIKMSQPMAAQVQLYSMTGTPVYSRRFAANGSGMYKNELPALPAGMYLVQVQTADGVHTSSVNLR